LRESDGHKGGAGRGEPEVHWASIFGKAMPWRNCLGLIMTLFGGAGGYGAGEVCRWDGVSGFGTRDSAGGIR
jgi:hypothetical protein